MRLDSVKLAYIAELDGQMVGIIATMENNPPKIERFRLEPGIRWVASWLADNHFLALSSFDTNQNVSYTMIASQKGNCWRMLITNAQRQGLH